MATTLPDEIDIEVPRGTDVVIRGTLGSSVSGYTFAFYITPIGSDTATITKTSAAGISVVTEATGVVDVTLLAANHDTELEIKPYWWTWWRTDSGNNRLLGHGKWIVTRGKPA